MVANSWRWLQLRHATRYTFLRFLSKTSAGLSRWEHLFSKPGSVTAIAAELRHLGKAQLLNDGKLLHAHVRKHNLDMYTYVGNCLIEMYANCGSLGAALHAFERLPNPNVYSWNMLIKAYCQNGSVLEAFHVFSSMPLKDSVSWNTIISAFAQHGHSKEALNLFKEMLEENFVPNNISFISALDACGHSSNLHQGQKIHASIVGLGCDKDVLIGTALLNTYDEWQKTSSSFVPADGSRWVYAKYRCRGQAALEEGQNVHAAIIYCHHEEDTLLCNALISLYAECGSMRDACRVFDRMQCRDAVSWTAIIDGSVRNGHHRQGLCLFHHMQIEGFKPDNITFVSVLAACGRSGWIDEGKHFFVSISQDYGMCISGEHYLCLISLLGRAGHLDDAEELIEYMPSEKAGMAWFSLLGSCKVHEDTERGLRSASFCGRLTPESIAPYVLLSNIIAADQFFEDIE
ncbi:hypothetical protein GOP47_0024745 [Adiantum capillus-veneris]|uniref:Pentatricopeptide repeat-containing protein n=1 Tax=Adiantum capillus-veneris TaxID=13818 RepID=A0A9D4Z3X2_ADICA|nr:hypothetical protein GOP47_0024745 [Adiantum capillus-veneris]